MPSPGLVRALGVPSGPGVRDDRGVVAGLRDPGVLRLADLQARRVGRDARGRDRAPRPRARRVSRRRRPDDGAVFPVADSSAASSSSAASTRRISTACWPSGTGSRSVTPAPRDLRGRGDRRRARRVVPRASRRRREPARPAAPGSAPGASRACDDLRGRDRRRDHDGRDRARRRRRSARRHVPRRALGSGPGAARATRSRPRGPTSACRCCSPPTIAASTSR